MTLHFVKRKMWAQVTSWKLCWVNLSAIRSSSRQECVSAKALMPRQLEGSSCLLRNSQQASWISASWRRQAAGRSVCTFPSSTVTWEQGGRTLEAYTCIITKLKMTQVSEKCTIFWKWLSFFPDRNVFTKQYTVTVMWICHHHFSSFKYFL